jgi:flavin-binding protein dodecin
MADSVYKVIELVGTSSESWEKAAKFAVDTAAKSLHDLRIAEIEKLDMQIEEGQVVAYRAKVKLGAVRPCPAGVQHCSALLARDVVLAPAECGYSVDRETRCLRDTRFLFWVLRAASNGAIGAPDRSAA